MPRKFTSPCCLNLAVCTQRPEHDRIVWHRPNIDACEFEDADGSSYAKHRLSSHSTMTTPSSIVPTAFAAAARTGDISALQSLISHWRSLHPSTPPPLDDLLPLALEHPHPATITFLLQNGAIIDRGCVEAAFSPSLSPSDTISILEAFTNSGWDINSSRGHAGGVLTLALGSPTPILSFLLARGADPNLNGAGAASVLDLAVLHASTEDVDELISYGAKLQNTNALKTAAYFGRTDMIEHLLGKGVDVNEIPDYEEMLRREREIGLGTALHEAARIGQVEAVRLLLDRGADPWLKNTLGRTALDLATEQGHDNVVKVLSETLKSALWCKCSVLFVFCTLAIAYRSLGST